MKLTKGARCPLARLSSSAPFFRLLALRPPYPTFQPFRLVKLWLPVRESYTPRHPRAPRRILIAWYVQHGGWASTSAQEVPLA